VDGALPVFSFVSQALTNIHLLLTNMILPLANGGIVGACCPTVPIAAAHVICSGNMRDSNRQQLRDLFGLLAQTVPLHGGGGLLPLLTSRCPEPRHHPTTEL
jgi:hypothetical protein